MVADRGQLQNSWRIDRGEVARDQMILRSDRVNELVDLLRDTNDPVARLAIVRLRARRPASRP
jgi:hypothetical protein